MSMSLREPDPERSNIRTVTAAGKASAAMNTPVAALSGDVRTGAGAGTATFHPAESGVFEVVVSGGAGPARPSVGCPAAS